MQKTQWGRLGARHKVYEANDEEAHVSVLQSSISSVFCPVIVHDLNSHAVRPLLPFNRPHQSIGVCILLLVRRGRIRSIYITGTERLSPITRCGESLDIRLSRRDIRKISCREGRLVLVIGTAYGH